MLLAAKENNFITFASTFRGLIESAADAYYSLADVPMTLAENHRKIIRALEGNLDAVLLAGVLEEKLIHFIYARKIEKGEVVPDYLQAKSARAYLSELQQAKEGYIHDCYSELCQITHLPGSDKHPIICSIPIHPAQLCRGLLLLPPGSQYLAVEQL